MLAFATDLSVDATFFFLSVSLSFSFFPLCLFLFFLFLCHVASGKRM